MNSFRVGVVLLFCSLGSFAAEPDWPNVEQHAIELLQSYVRIASINPPADTSATAKFLQEQLAAAGIESKLYQSAPGGKTNLLARLPGKDRTKRPLLLLNHMDVVPVDASRWKEDPFGAQIHDGIIWGRGTLDMKSTGITELTALLLMKQLGITPPADIVFLATCDEETGGVDGAQWMIDHHWDELNPAYVLDEGGVGSSDLYSPGRLIFGVSVADKQVLWLRLRATGTSGHGSQPIPDNANDMLLHAIARAQDLAHTDKPNPVVEQMHQIAGTFAANKFMNAIQQNTMSVTSLRSGVGNPPKVNVIPSIAEATLDCRLLPGQNYEEFISEVKARINDAHISVEQVSPKPDDVQPSTTDTPLFHAIQAAIQQHAPGAAVMPLVAPYGTDAQKFRVRGVPSYGIIPMVVDQATLATLHSDMERIPLDQFRRALHIYFDIVRSDW